MATILGPAHKAYRYVNRVGIELEGGWNDPLEFALDHDGSVNVAATHNGEIPSPPLKPRDIPKWMLEHYPDAVNATCGMHVHVSVNHQWHYARLMEREFLAHVKNYLTKWGTELAIRKTHPFWSRLAGHNHYCRDEFRPESQISHRDKGGERYTMLNYTWNRYRTVECRVLPGFAAPEIGISAVYAVVDAFEAYLRLVCKANAPALIETLLASETPDDNEAIL